MPDQTRMILVVDDDPGVRGVVARQLGLLGYEVVTSESAAQALTAIRDRVDAVDLVLTDINMQGMDGFELGRELARVRPGLPVIYMSGRPVPGTLTKPFDRLRLRDAVETALKYR